MKTKIRQFLQTLTAALVVVSLGISTARAITFTSNTSIGFSDTIYDGSDITVTNCTLTVNGTHSFASLRVLNGGVVTHPFNPSGLVGDVFSITDEAHALNGTNAEALFYSNAVASTVFVTDEFGLTLYFGGVDYVLVSPMNGQVMIQRTDSSAIPDGSIVLVSYFVQNPAAPTGMNLSVTGDVLVELGGSINVNGRGLGNGFGQGQGGQAGNPLSGAGGGHGGYGGMSSSNAPGGASYGLIIQPVDKGSAGGSGVGGIGGSGGGSIKLVVSGVLQINGVISANGANGINTRSGGGSGGSIWLSAQSASGTGSISADGGVGEPIHGGGGGGGRVAVYFYKNHYSGMLSAHGGNGFIAGGAGTIYIYPQTNDQPVGLVLVDNGGRNGTNTPLSLLSTADLTVRGGAVVVQAGPPPQTLRNLLVESNGWIWIGGVPSSSGVLPLVAANATIKFGGGILADGTGFLEGPGVGSTTNAGGNLGTLGSGGGYGGYGASVPGARGGSGYGSLFNSSDFGSGSGGGGRGGSGGGAIHFIVNGALVLDGKISANGNRSPTVNGGGGSGGSIWILAGTLSGSGLISANGGNGNSLGGGGGGGRTLIQYATNSAFSGIVSAHGGSGSGDLAGGAGTIYTVRGGVAGLLADGVLLDNGGRTGAITTFGSYSTFTANLTVAGGASLVWPTGSPFTIRNLLVTSNAWLLVTNPVQTTLTITSNAIVGGTIIADGGGFPAMAGTGAGRAGTSIGKGGSGGGYGGYGAIGSGGTPGGITYGSLSQPSDRGSGGGNGVLPNNSGGTGGGALRINMEHGLLQLDGRILANGISGSGTNGGGGSGGSIWITVGRFSGSGIVSANGGAGGAMGGGGGGGGRVSVSYGTNTFLGALSAFGGSGFAVGGAGTVYLQNINQKAYAVVVDNGGQLGAGTSLGGSVPSQSDLTLTGGAILPVTGTISLNNLFIGTNSRLVFTNPTPVILTIASNAIIQAGGGLVADSGGSSMGSGLGAGRSSSTGNGGSGAGYGGSGAPGSGGTPGGPAYGSLTQGTPLTGSGGGNGILPNNIGGAGGGAVQLTANTLRLDGRISANGNSGGGTNGGGGSGGTILISIRKLFSGSGIVSANGGNGTIGGGGGGGGRIGIAYGTNTFSGAYSAFGGTGFAVGGAGTIVFQSSAPSIGVSGFVIVDNGGPLGASTPLGSLPFGVGSGYDITVTRGAVLAPTASLTLGNLLITSNSWLLLTNAVTTQITVNSNATILAGGRISGDGDALVSSRDGSGGIFQTPTGVVGGGGGHGGYGSPGIPGGAGGTAFDSAIQPTMRGGNGGSQIASGPSSGGAGGAAIRLSVRGKLLLDGKISADGHDGISPNSGGGAGGSILLTLGNQFIGGLPPQSGIGILEGAGIISANGGRGNGAGGSGGGGRISISYVTNNFTGIVTAFGGRGTNVGGAGTIFYTKPLDKQIGQMLADNGGYAGANTLLLLSDQGGFDLTVQGSAVLQVPSPTATYRNLLVASNSFLIVSNSTTITATTSATVQKTGGIKADGSSTTGPGNGLSLFTSPYGYSGGGGSHGGYGGASLGGAASGNYYDSIQSPSSVGSRGGGSPSDTTGIGGGAIRLNSSKLQLDGFISANGTAGKQNGGGGSGGSVWLNVGSLIGSGIISANGGAGGNSIGGGGGGGRISVQYTTNNFTGSMSAFGGGGGQNGGAGTVYIKANNQPVAQITVDNAGSLGTNTPLANLPLADLTVKNGAVAHPVNSSVALNKLTVGAGGWLMSGINQSVLDLTVFSNAVVEAGGFLAVDAKGFAQGTGLGAGQSAGGLGSGAGYGANGGATATAAGGASYGSAQQPVDPGSGGGLGSGPTYAGGSRGGGALRMNVGGKLTVDGWLSAEGTDGLQDNSGGGSGGSIWVTAKAVDGSGFIAADGGFGELFGGGGGAGGRIAIYSPSNEFSGLTSVNGGDGAFPGGNGTVYSSAALPALQIIGQTPSGIVSNNVTSVEITFSTPVNPVSFSGQDYMLTTPTWLVYGTNLSYSVLAPERYQIISGSLTEVGDYKVIVGPDITDIFGQPMSQVYTGAFTIVLPVVRGRVTDTNGQPVSGVLLDPGAGMSTTLSDTNGNYTVGFVPGSSFTVTPSLNGFMFAPGSRSYTNMTANIANEDYMVVSTIAPSLGAGGLQGPNPTMSWFGLPGVTYQLFSTTNLVDWLPYGSPITGSNTVIQIPLPVEGGPMEFFKVQADN